MNAAAHVPGRFSVIVPSFQQGEFLERTLQSVLNQDYRDLEIIVQDGGSTDRSVEILKRYADRVQWESKRDNGQSSAINEGLRKATGEYLCYLNSDDVFYPGTLRRVRDFFAAHPEAEIVYGLADFIDEQDQLIGPYPVEPWNYERLRETCFLCQPACFWRRSIIDRHGFFDESLQYSMDYEYWLRVGVTTKFQLLPEKLAGSRCHAQAKGFGQSRAHHRATISVLQRYHGGRVPPRWIVAYARHLAEEQLRRGGPKVLRWVRFVLSYWIGLLTFAPRVTPGGLPELLRKIGPPYPSACQRVRDPLGYLRKNFAPRV